MRGIGHIDILQSSPKTSPVTANAHLNNSVVRSSSSSCGRRHSRSTARQSTTENAAAKEQERGISGDGGEPNPGNVSEVLSLLGVSAIWSTYSPALRYLYLQPGPPQPAALTAVRAVMQAVSLLPLVGLQQAAGRDGVEEVDAGLAARGGTVFWRAAMELGAFNFCGTALQAAGLETTTAVRAAFLIQATALFTPVIDGLSGGFLSPRVWGATALGAVGTLIFTAASHDVAATSSAATESLQQATLRSGDLAVLGAALCYSLTTIRIGAFAKQLTPIDLALAKSIGLAALSAGWGLSAAVSVQMHGQPLTSLWEGYRQPAAWAMLAFLAGSGALAAYLQTRGQGRIQPAQAQILFSTTPIWSTLLAITLLGEANLDAQQVTGGVLILLATLLASSDRSDASPSHKSDVSRRET